MRHYVQSEISEEEEAEAEMEESLDSDKEEPKLRQGKRDQQ